MSYAIPILQILKCTLVQRYLRTLPKSLAQKVTRHIKGRKSKLNFFESRISSKNSSFLSSGCFVNSKLDRFENKIKMIILRSEF